MDKQVVLPKYLQQQLVTPLLLTKHLLLCPRQDDEIIINRVSGDETGVFKISLATLVSSVPIIPIGTIVSFGGTVIPARLVTL